MGNSRCSNMMGRDTTTNVIDSETSAGAWAVLSTDAGDDMYLNVYNSSLTLNNADESAAAPLQAEGGQILHNRGILVHRSGGQLGERQRRECRECHSDG
jgi:hypothetical protein